MKKQRKNIIWKYEKTRNLQNWFNFIVGKWIENNVNKIQLNTKALKRRKKFNREKVLI